MQLPSEQDLMMADLARDGTYCKTDLDQMWYSELRDEYNGLNQMIDERAYGMSDIHRRDRVDYFMWAWETKAEWYELDANELEEVMKAGDMDEYSEHFGKFPGFTADGMKVNQYQYTY